MKSKTASNHQANSIPTRYKIKSRPWFLRPMTPAEHEDGMSARRMVASRLRANSRLKELGDIEEEIKQRASASYITYLLPLLIQDESGQPVFDASDPKSMAELDRLPNGVTGELVTAFWEMFSNLKRGKVNG